MHVDVEYHLASLFAVVEDHPEAVGNPVLLGQLAADAYELADQLVILFQDIHRGGNMFFGNDQQMDRSLLGDR